VNNKVIDPKELKKTIYFGNNSAGSTINVRDNC